jgi:hypothetical protein
VTYAHRKTSCSVLCWEVIAELHSLNSVVEKCWFDLGIMGICHRVLRIGFRKTEHQVK